MFINTTILELNFATIKNVIWLATHGHLSLPECCKVLLEREKNWLRNIPNYLLGKRTGNQNSEENVWLEKKYLMEHKMGLKRSKILT